MKDEFPAGKARILVTKGRCHLNKSLNASAFTPSFLRKQEPLASRI